MPIEQTATVATQLVAWDDIFSVLRRAAPKFVMYGDGGDGDTRKMLAMLRDDALITRVAAELWNIDCAHRARTQKHVVEIKAADKDRLDRINALVEAIK